jgi:hypothetical protein
LLRVAFNVNESSHDKINFFRDKAQQTPILWDVKVFPL